MEHRLGDGLAIAGLLCSLLEAEEQRSRPASAGDQTGNFRERLVAPPAIDNAVVEHADSVAGSPPLSDQNRSRRSLALRDNSHELARCPSFTEAIEQSSGGGLETTERT